jgi:hypothetical protein
MEVFQELFENNKYLIKIYNNDANWVIYMFKNKKIQLDIHTPQSLTSSYIDIPKMLEYIESLHSELKIKYTYHYDDYEHYKKTIDSILEKIKAHFSSKSIVIKNKFYYS